MMTIRVRLIGALTFGLVTSGLAVPLAAGQAVATLRFGATVQAKTSLTLSTTELRIEPRSPGDTGPVVAGTVDFLASARTRTGGEVLLTVESLERLDVIGGGASEGATAIDFEGNGEGAVGGSLATTPRVAARWVGSGRHTGRLTFIVRGPVAPGGAVVPLRFVLSLP